MDVGTVENSSAITNTRKHGGWNNWEFICNKQIQENMDVGTVENSIHVFLYLLLQMNSQLFQPPCFLVVVIADEISVVPTSMFFCICYCRWILSCSNLHVFLYLLLQMNSQLFQPPCFLVFVIADEFSVVPISMFSCICYCRWILNCSNIHVFLYLFIADEFSVVPTSMFSCICYCRWILNCSKSAITNTRKHGVWNNWEFICNNKYKKTWRLEQLRIHLQ